MTPIVWQESLGFGFRETPCWPPPFPSTRVPSESRQKSELQLEGSSQSQSRWEPLEENPGIEEVIGIRRG